MKQEWTRRTFLKQSSLTSIGLTLGVSGITAKSYSRIAGANEKVRFAVVGVRSRGLEHIQSIGVSQHGVVSHVCDVDRRYLEKAASLVQENSGMAPKMEKDIRKLLESKELDAITIATPEHWHTPMAILGLQADKHVYVEKPPAHNPAEGELLIRAQEKYGKLIQMGTQQRSSLHTQEAIQKIHEGLIGRVYLGRTWYNNQRSSIGHGMEVPVPDYLDWDLWQGPAPRKPYKDNIHPYNWHWFRHWGTGESLNNATHEIDLCLWAMKAGFPEQLAANGGRYHFQDDWEFYDTLNINFVYPDKMITWEGNSCSAMKTYDRGRGAVLHGTEGAMLIDRNGYEIYDTAGDLQFVYEKEIKDETTAIGGGGPMTDAHFQNFINAIRSGESLNAPIQQGNVSTAMLLLSNIAWETGQRLRLNAENGHILDNPDAMKLWSRTYEPGWEPVIE